MKVALVTFHNDIGQFRVGGVATGPIYFKGVLSRYTGHDPDILVVGPQHKNSGFLDQVEFVTENVPDRLNQYEFIIFNTPGFTYEDFDESRVGHAYDYVLNGLNTPFAFIVNEERDRYLYPYYMEFVEHPMLKFVLFNSIGMHEDFPEMYEKCGKWIEYNYMIPLDDIDTILKRFDQKDYSKIISTARWTDRKRVAELAQMTPRLKELGFDVTIAGAAQNYFASRKVLVNTECWTNRGYYTPDQLPEMLSDKAFHYNFVCTKRPRKNQIMRPRLELATYEAFNQGCLPIVCTQTSPDWVKNYCCVALDKDQLSDLPEILSKLTVGDMRVMMMNFMREIEINVVPMWEAIGQAIYEEGKY